jgi:tetratricopeptide (TPR) repeat protein
MKQVIYFLFLLLCVNAFSQKSDITSAIIALDNQKDLESAKKWIDVATGKIKSGSDLKPKIMAKYRHYKGLIYLKKFQSSDSKSLADEDRFSFLKTAASAFLADAITKSNFSKKSINQLSICAYLYQEGAYKNYENKEYNLALNKFIEAININSSESIQKIDTFNMYNASLMAFQSNDYEASAMWSSKLVDIDAKDQRFHIRLISAYNEMGDLNLQLDAIKNARLQLPQSKEIIFEEVNYYLAIGDNTLLLESLDNAVQSDSLNAVLHLVLGNTYSQLGDLQKAEASFLKSIELDEDYFDAYNNLASLYLDQAAPLVEKKNGLSYKQEKLFNKYTKQINNFYNQALPHLESCLKIHPEHVQIADALKEIYYKLDKPKDSMKMKELIDLPNDQKKSFVADFFSK